MEHARCWVPGAGKIDLLGEPSFVALDHLFGFLVQGREALVLCVAEVDVSFEVCHVRF